MLELPQNSNIPHHLLQSFFGDGRDAVIITKVHGKLVSLEYLDRKVRDFETRSHGNTAHNGLRYHGVSKVAMSY